MMSNTLAHIAVAKRVLESCPSLVSHKALYFLGAIAPDAIGSKPSATHIDKRFVHLRYGIRDAEWLQSEKLKLFQSRIGEFVREYILNDAVDSFHKSFNIGYLVHLLTDKYNHMTIRQDMLKIAHSVGIHESDQAFYEMMITNLEALDYYLLIKDPAIQDIFDEIKVLDKICSIPAYISEELLQASLSWWDKVYLKNLGKRAVKDLQPEDIDFFVENSAEKIKVELKHLFCI